MGLVYESVILFAVVFFFGYAFSALTQFKGAPGWGRHALQAWIFFVLAAYFVYFWSAGRRSLPMKTLELLVTDEAGRSLQWPRALWRYCAACLCLIVPLAAAQWLHGAWSAMILVPFLTMPFDSRRRTLYDMVSGSVLLHSPPTKVSDTRPAKP